MSHYSELVDKEHEKNQEQKKRYLIGMLQAGKYDEYLDFCHANGFVTIQVPIADFSFMVKIIKDMN
jgi:hypothetical protein